MGFSDWNLSRFLFDFGACSLCYKDLSFELRPQCTLRLKLGANLTTDLLRIKVQ